MISTQNLSHFEPVGNRNRFMKAVGYLDFDYYFAEVGKVQIGSFDKQMECDMIYQSSLTISFFPTLLTRNITWLLASLIITEYDFNTKSLTLWARRKPKQVYESRRLSGFRLLFRWGGDGPNRIFRQTNGMWYDLPIIFNDIVLSNRFSSESQHYILTYLYLPWYIPRSCCGCSYWNIA